MQTAEIGFVIINLYEIGIFEDNLIAEGVLLLENFVYPNHSRLVPIFYYNKKVADLFIHVETNSLLPRPVTTIYKKKTEEFKLFERSSPIVEKESAVPVLERNSVPIRKKQEIDLAIYGIQLSNVVYDKMIYCSQSGKQEVYIGKISTTNTPIAIKVSYCDGNEEFNKVQREALALIQLSHPNICKVYASLLEINEGKPKNLIILEHCEGKSLRHEIESRNPTKNYFTQSEV